jgi:hypothetical protein
MWCQPSGILKLGVKACTSQTLVGMRSGNVRRLCMESRRNVCERMKEVVLRDGALLNTNHAKYIRGGRVEVCACLWRESSFFSALQVLRELKVIVRSPEIPKVINADISSLDVGE